MAALFFAGCTETGTETGSGAGADTWELEDPSTVAPEAKDDASDVGVPNNVITPTAGCSVVQWCNAPGADGARCLQQGCTLGAALNECTNETLEFCGTPVCPWIFVTLSGQRLVNGSCL